MVKKNPLTTKAWGKLKEHYEVMKKRHMRDMFARDPQRFKKFSLQFEDILVDYSKNIIDETTIKLLLELATELKLKEAIEEMFKGEKINETENRAVLHTALRNRSGEPIYFEGRNITEEITSVLKKMEEFSGKIISGQWRGYSDRPIKDIVNIGIGGSCLGPKMAYFALQPYRKPHINVHFVSNVDGTHLTETLKKLDPATTLFIIVSKTFTTQETMTNATSSREWFLKQAKDASYIKKHFVAVSANTNKVKEFGIDPENMFMFWNWVGGRYSVWSAVGLSLACAIGFDNFAQFLEGAYLMDKHFRFTNFEDNIPVILGLISLWYVNFFGAQTEAVLPYDQYLEYFPAYLQQLYMESNGKNTDRSGKEVNYQTSPVIWGEPGTGGQHSFYQLLHQGTPFLLCDFLAPVYSHNPLGEHHKILLSNFFAQTEALMKGKTEEEVEKELKEQGRTEEEIKKLLPYKVFPGNKPTNSILFKKLTPKTLGSLIALYEHKVFTQGVIWNIFSFDQWGVELGKQLAKNILSELNSPEIVKDHDCSTCGLINFFKKFYY